MSWRPLLKLLLCCVLLSGWTAGFAAPAAGVVISNTALASFLDTGSGRTVRLNSNTVNTRVTALEALTLTANQAQLLATGAPFTLAHTLTNTGNTASTFRFTTSVAPASGFTPTNLQLLRDVNGNGRADPGEPVIPATGLDLPMGASASLLLTGQVPPTGLAGQSAQLVLTATTQAQGAQASNTDTLTLTSGAAVQVVLSASTAAPTPSSFIDWTLVAVNNGASGAAGMNVTIDGSAANLFVLRAPVPVNANFTSATASPNVSARTLYHLAGSPANAYVSAVPVVGTVDGVAWSLPVLAAGASLQGQFRVQVHGNAAGTITETAHADWVEGGSVQLASSNTVVLPLPPRSAQVAFYTGGTYTTPALQNSPGRPLFIQADAAQCNADAVAIDTVQVRVTSQLTGDIEIFSGVETGANTGVFRIQPEVPTADAATHVVVAGDGILEVLRNDTVTATVTPCVGGSAVATTTLLIDPSGIVFDSRSNQPLSGATVTLIDVTGNGNGGRPGMEAVVLQADGSTPAPSTVVTGADGVYAFPLVGPSTYQLRITAPAGYVFPSTVAANQMPLGRVIDASASYGGNFSAGTGAVRIDVPLDTGGRSGLFVQKTANKATAEVGDFVDYTVTVRNVAAAAMTAVQLDDALPAGFAYVRGSARVDGATAEDPTGGTGPRLGFALGTIGPGAQRVLNYRLRLGAGSQSGDGVNSAQAASGGTRSNRASVKVQVLGGVFANEGYVIGKVYADCRRNGVQDAGDPGIPGVRIYLEDGTYAVTDEEGKYSLYGLSPRTHVAKLDRTTLPAGAVLQVLDNRNALDAGSRFVDLKNGELLKADFAVAGCDDALKQNIAARRQALRNPAEIDQAAGVLLSATTQAAVSDARSLPSSGSLGVPGAARASASQPALGAVGDTGGPVGAIQQGLPQPLYRPATSDQAQAPAETASAPAAPLPLEELLPQQSAETGFIGLQEGQAMAGLQTPVRVKGPLGAEFVLTVNGQVVPATQVGKRSSLPQTRVTAWEYIGVDLKPGRNTLEVKVQDGFGNVRGRAQVTLLAPGPLSAIRVGVPEQPVADGATPVAVTVSLRDAQDLPVHARTQVTLQASAGQWQVQDADPHQPGAQVMVEGGTGRFLLLPPANPGRAELTVLAGTAKSQVAVQFVPSLRPLIAAGIVEGTLNLRNLSPSALQPAQSGDVFEREIRSVSRSFDNGKADASARAALFLKGKVLGSSLLTLAYDSDKASDMRLFRDIEPNRFYPVYGDSSARGFDAQSSGRLYVLLQNGGNYALVGDFSTQTDNAARQLTQYARSLNGVKGRWNDGKVGVEAFASRTNATQVVQEFRGNGTSGPFQLDTRGVANSEQVHVITRSRDQSAVVLKDTALAAYVDYAIETTTGQLLLKAPVPSVDSDLNPMYVRVTYDLDTGGPEHTVAGVEATVQVAPGTTVGALAVRDDDPANRLRLEGVTLSSRLGEKTIVTAEAARSRTDLQGDGQGQRVELRHEGAGLQVHAWGARTDTGFHNPGSPQSAGQSQYGAKAGYNLDATRRVVGEVLKTSDASTGAEQVGAELKLEQTLPGNAKLEVGVRHSSANEQATQTSATTPGTSTAAETGEPAMSSDKSGYTSARLKLTVPVPGVPQADVYGLLEQAIAGSTGREAGIGANYAVSPGTKLYARHDFINSLQGPYTFSSDVSRYTTVAGVDTSLAENTQLFNEYRVGDALDGRTAEAALGLRRTIRLPMGLNVSASLQRIKPVSGPTNEDSSAIALGAEYIAAADWKASGQLQWQTSASSRSQLASGALVNRVGREWTLLNRFLYHEEAPVGGTGGSHERVAAQSGVAYRPVDTNTWNALARIEYKRDQDTTVVTGADQSTWLLSTHLNVQPSRDWSLNARYAAKKARDRANDFESTSFTQLFGARSVWDIDSRWDVGVQAYALWGNGAVQSAVGLEVGYLVWKNLWLSVGYNFLGFSARDMAGEAHTMKGAYVRLRFKFDETLLDAPGAAPAAGARPEAGQPVSQAKP